jgi:hypothetical protein
LSRGNADSIDAAAQSDVPQFVTSNLWDREFILSISCAKIAIDGRAHGSGHAGNSGDFAFSRNPEAHAAMVCIRRTVLRVILRNAATKDLSSFRASTET